MLRLQSYPVDTGGKLNVYKTFRRGPGRLLKVAMYVPRVDGVNS